MWKCLSLSSETTRKVTFPHIPFSLGFLTISNLWLSHWHLNYIPSDMFKHIILLQMTHYSFLVALMKPTLNGNGLHGFCYTTCSTPLWVPILTIHAQHYLIISTLFHGHTSNTCCWCLVYCSMTRSVTSMCNIPQHAQLPH